MDGIIALILTTAAVGQAPASDATIAHLRDADQQFASFVI